MCNDIRKLELKVRLLEDDILRNKYGSYSKIESIRSEIMKTRSLIQKLKWEQERARY